MGGDNSSLFKKRVSSPLYNTVANIYTYTEAKKINTVIGVGTPGWIWDGLF